MYFDKLKTVNAEVTYSRFDGVSSTEFNLMVTPTEKGSVDNQLEAIREALNRFMDKFNLEQQSIVFQRFFASDLTNQSDKLANADLLNCDCAVSIIQQTPLDGTKIGLWTCLMQGSNNTEFKKEKEGKRVVMSHNDYSHVYTTQMHGQYGDVCSYKQTNQIFGNYLDLLKGMNLTLEEHCIRTWFYVRDIDNNYAGMVKARNEVFEENRLTKDTHYITSTGIEGQFTDPGILVVLDAYAIGGIKPEQIKFLQALDNLNPTHEYGVAFERGTAIDYGDRRHIFISGTASIDKKGQIVHKGDIYGQIERTFENIQALLKTADAELDDTNSMIVYLRDVADYDAVKTYISTYYPHIPHILVKAPVCRPGWLIEIECIAIKQISNSDFHNF